MRDYIYSMWPRCEVNGKLFITQKKKMQGVFLGIDVTEKMEDPLRKNMQADTVALLKKLMDSLFAHAFLSVLNYATNNTYENLGRGVSLAALRHLGQRYVCQKAWNEEKERESSDAQLATKECIQATLERWSSREKVQDFIKTIVKKCDAWRKDVATSKFSCFGV